MLSRELRPTACWCDFLSAALYSILAMAVFAGLLVVFRWHEAPAAGSNLQCSIIDCLVSCDGRRALVTYRRLGHVQSSLQLGLATVDLQGRSGRFQIAPTQIASYALARIDDDRSYIIGANRQVIVRSNDSAESFASDGFALPEGCLADVTPVSDSHTYLTTSTNGQLQLFDPRQNLVRWERDVDCFTLHPQCGLHAVLPNRAIVQLSIETGEVLRTIAWCQASALALAIDPLGTTIASLDCTGGVEANRLRDGKSRWRQLRHGSLTMPPSYRANIISTLLSFSADGSDLVTSASEGEWVLAIWDVKTGDRVSTLRGHDHPINGATFLPDGSLASWAADGTLRLWDARRGVVLRVFSIDPLPSLFRRLM